MFKIPIYQVALNGNEKKYVNECLDSTWISSKGKFLKLFKEKFADYINAKYAACVTSGTVALHLALTALDIKSEDEVIVPSLTYIASVNAISYVGAIPVFADSLKSTWQIDPEDVIKKITSKTKAIMVVHLYGHPCDMDAFKKIAQQYNLLLIEDCAEAFGTKYKGQHVGTFGHISIFSFFGNKTITTGEGGMVVTNYLPYYEKTVHYKSQGCSNAQKYFHDVIGFNYRMTNICAAIGLGQLEKCDEIIHKKRQIAKWYKESLQGLPIEFQVEEEHVTHSHWMFSILVEKEKRDDLREHLGRASIETRPFFHPIHFMPMYNKKAVVLPIAELLGASGLNLPSWHELDRSTVEFIASEIKKFYH